MSSSDSAGKVPSTTCRKAVLWTAAQQYSETQVGELTAETQDERRAWLEEPDGRLVPVLLQGNRPDSEGMLSVLLHGKTVRASPHHVHIENEDNVRDVQRSKQSPHKRRSGGVVSFADQTDTGLECREVQAASGHKPNTNTASERYRDGLGQSGSSLESSSASQTHPTFNLRHDTEPV